MRDAPYISVKPLSGISPEEELDALANVYRFIFDCHAKRKAAEPAPEPADRDGSIKIRTKGKEATML